MHQNVYHSRGSDNRWRERTTTPPTPRIGAYLLGGAAVRIVALPEAPHVAPNVAGHALGELEARIPAQRAVAEHPHGGVGGILATGRRRGRGARRFRVAVAVVQLEAASSGGGGASHTERGGGLLTGGEVTHEARGQRKRWRVYYAVRWAGSSSENSGAAIFGRKKRVSSGGVRE